MKNLKIILISIFIVTALLNAHEREKHKKSEQDTIVVQSDSLTKPQAVEERIGQIQPSANFEIQIPDMIFEHMHNKIVHFPIALSIGAFLFTLLNFYWPKFDLTVKILVLLSAAAAAISGFTGFNQAAHFTGEPVEWVVDKHKTFGLITTSGLLLWSVFLFIKPFKKYSWLIGAILFIVVLITGFYGGVIAAS